VIIKEEYSGTKGLYVSVTPDEKTKEIIKAVASVLDTPCQEDLHCTLMYSREKALRTDLYVYRPTSFNAAMSEIHLLGPNKDVLVILLESEELQKEFNRLTSLGAEYTYPTYLPHITINHGQPYDDYYLESVETMIKGKKITLGDYRWYDLVESKK
jgi:hypothetical protein